MSTLAFAADDATRETVLATFTPIISALVLGLVIPFLVALVTKQVSAPALKSVLLLLLSLIAGGVNELIAQGADFQWQGWALNATVTLLTGIAMVLGLKPLVGQTGAIQNAVPGGIGKQGANIVPAGTEPTVVAPVAPQAPVPPQV